MNQENTVPNENRYLNKYEKNIKRIKNGIILVIIFAIVIGASYALIEIQFNWTAVTMQNNYIRYRNDEITSDTYYSIERNLEYDRFYFRWLISIVSNLAEVGMNIGFLIVILGFFYFAIDKSYNKKMRRMSLILAGVILVFMTFLNFEYLLPSMVEVIYQPYW